MSVGWKKADLKSIPNNGLNVMSTFSGGGGSSYGYKLAGCNLIACNEIDPKMADHYKRNHSAKTQLILKPIADCVIDAVDGNLSDDLYKLDILDGSPPCSTFSTSGSREKGWGVDKKFREGQAKQVLSDLFFDYLDLVEALRPKVSIAENVKGMLFGNARGYTKMVVERYRELGYNVQVFSINGADCGVPQIRERVFFCALRDDITKPKLVLKPTCEWVPLSEAFKGIKAPDIEELEYLKLSPLLKNMWHKTRPGDSFVRARLREGESNAFFSWRKLHPGVPAHTLSATPTLCHWESPRIMSSAECCRISTFPDDYEADNSKFSSYIYGMSVPPFMTRAVAEAVRDQWLL